MRTGLLQWPGRLNGNSHTVKRIDGDFLKCLPCICALSVFILFPTFCGEMETRTCTFDPRGSGKLLSPYGWMMMPFTDIGS